MKLSACEVIKKGELTKSPPLDGKRKKRWMKRFFVLYKPHDDDKTTEEEYEKEKENYLKNHNKTKRSSFVKLFRSSNENKNKQVNCVSLLYFENEEKESQGSPPLNHIPLTGAFVSENPEPVNGHKYVIDLQTSSRKFYLCADSEQEHKSWLEKLKETIEATELRRNSIFNGIDTGPPPEDLLGDGGLQYQVDKLRIERIQQTENNAAFLLENTISDTDNKDSRTYLNNGSNRSSTESGGRTERRTTENDISEDDVYDVPPTSSNKSNFHSNPGMNTQGLDTSEDDVYDYDVPPTSSNKSNFHSNPGMNTQGLVTSEDDVYDVPPTSSSINNFHSNPGMNTHGLNISEDDVYDIPPTSSSKSNFHSYPGLNTQGLVTSEDDVYDVPPTSSSINNFHSNPGMNTHRLNISEDDVYDVPPTSSNKSNFHSNPGMNTQGLDTSEDDIYDYDVPPTSSSKSNFHSNPGMNTQGLDTSEDDVYDVPPTSSSSNNFRLSTNVNNQTYDVDHHEYVNVKREQAVPPTPNRSTKPTFNNNQIESFYGNVDEILNSTADSDTFETPTLHSSAHNSTNVSEEDTYDTPPVHTNQHSITSFPNASDANNNSTDYRGDQEQSVYETPPPVSLGRPKPNNKPSLVHQEAFDNKKVTKMPLECPVKPLPNEPSGERMLNHQPQIPKRAPRKTFDSNWKCSSLPTFYDTSFDEACPSKKNYLNKDSRAGTVPRTEQKNHLEEFYQPMSSGPINMQKNTDDESMNDDDYLKYNPSSNQSYSGNIGPNRFRRTAPKNY